MSIQLKTFSLHVLNMRTRLPFRYGVATLTALPHLVARCAFEVDGRSVEGFAADGLPPKWFKKDADQPYRQELAELVHCMENACGFAEEAGRCDSPFDLWQAVYAAQQHWAFDEAYPALMWHFGVTFAERAAIDAWCRARGETFAGALRTNTLGVRLMELHAELQDAEPADLLPDRPLDRVAVRHTVGLTDPLGEDEVGDADAIDDGLPRSLAASIDRYGLGYFKIKLSGDAAHDAERLGRIAGVLEAHAGHDYRITLDGNEQFASMAAFRESWQALAGNAAVRPLLERLVCVEQPVHRDAAMSVDTAETMEAWLDRPAMIIDESDATLASLGEALECGYTGTSYKNCKGVFKGIGNACLLAHRQREQPDARFIMTGEDLANVGPIALQQDCAAAAALGIGHVERNGHHYFAGLSMWPDAVQADALAKHGDLYEPHAAGWPTLRIVEGQIDLTSVNAAPFGSEVDIDCDALTAIDDWSFDSL